MQTMYWARPAWKADNQRPACSECGKESSYNMEYASTPQSEPSRFTVWTIFCFDHKPNHCKTDHRAT